MKKCIYNIILSSALLSFSGHGALANGIQELRPLSFGVFSILPGSNRSIVLAPTGAETMPDGGLINLRSGQTGIFKLTDLAPSSTFFISVDPTSIEHVSQSTPSFIIDSFTFEPNNGPGNPLTPDPDNTKTIYIGATLHVAPNTTSTPGAYHGTYDFMINF